jgi:hypothetical protein
LPYKVFRNETTTIQECFYSKHDIEF